MAPSTNHVAMSKESDGLPILLLLGGVVAVVALSSFTGDSSTTTASLAYLNKYTGDDPDAFANAVVAVANALGISANDLMFVMNNETAGTFSPTIQPWPTSDHSLNLKLPIGLIQFEPGTAMGLETTTAALAQMTAIDQLQYVQDYMQQIIDTYGPLNTTAKVYLAIFYPSAITQYNDPLFTFPTAVQNQNPEFFKGTDGTIQDFLNWVQSAIPSAYKADYPAVV